MLAQLAQLLQLAGESASLGKGREIAEAASELAGHAAELAGEVESWAARSYSELLGY